MLIILNRTELKLIDSENYAHHRTRELRIEMLLWLWKKESLRNKHLATILNTLKIQIR